MTLSSWSVGYRVKPQGFLSVTYTDFQRDYATNGLETLVFQSQDFCQKAI